MVRPDIAVGPSGCAHADQRRTRRLGLLRVSARGSRPSALRVQNRPAGDAADIRVGTPLGFLPWRGRCPSVERLPKLGPDPDGPLGGFTTKLHLVVEQGQKPLSIVVTAGQRGDSPQFEAVLEKIRVPRVGVGRPRIRPDRVRADKAYASRKNRAYLRRRGIRCAIPDKARPGASPQAARLPRRSAAEVRPGRLPRAPRGRVRHQSPQKASCRGHEIRQTRGSLRGNRSRRGHQRVAVTSIFVIRPRPLPSASQSESP
ncbi:transposase [Streptomyces sp. SP18BB07]|nr:transposase [Streptomyces sp. SP18BB07]MEE1757602.1 transposase [Streptomyces sp. SP18BB07]